MQIINQRISLFLGILISAMFFVSCLSNVDNSNPSVVQLGMELQNIDSLYTLQDDSIRVDNVRFIVGDSQFNYDDTSLVVNNQPRMLEFDPEQSQFRNPLVLVSGGVPAGTYQSYFIDIPQAPRDDQDIDSGFTDENNRYSMIVRGEYNGTDFNFKSDQAFTNTFTFGPLVIEDDNNQYVFLIQTDVQNWFVGSGSGGLLDPSNGDNSAQININIGNSITFEQL